MDNNRIQVNVDQTVGEMGEDARAIGVELNVYPHFLAAPERLRRSFDVLIADKIRGFVGRQFVFDALNEFLHTHESGYFIIRGVPGIGKSALMAKLVNDRGYIHHFNIASQNIRSTRTFLENVSAQLIARYGLQHKELPPGGADDGGFLMQCLGEAAAKVEESVHKLMESVLLTRGQGGSNTKKAPCRKVPHFGEMTSKLFLFNGLEVCRWRMT